MNCRYCHDTSPYGCDKCFFWYYLREDGSCAFSNLKGLSGVSLFAAVVAVVVFFGKSRRVGSFRGTAKVPNHHEYIGMVTQMQAMGSQPDATVPSGMWRGYYTFAGSRHDVCEFNLTFSGQQITGTGVDDVGKYDIIGIGSSTRIAFSKTYEARTTNVSGVRHYGNRGHTVEYRGELLGDSLGSGFRGTWSIRSHGSSDGQFHIWPSMGGWGDTESTMGRSTTEVFEECECVVCYDRTINTCLRPCGHVALCSVCASRLSPRKCPLCRRSISVVETRPLRASEKHRD